ncbi:MAG: PilZ domain-containing protein [Roseibium album]|uniref:PilZ domain-containing protein n=1 Tax=Roseibium album TaxID=311410 RepID=UPI0032ED4766
MSTFNAVRTADNCVAALVVDLADMTCFEASVLDLTDKGCWIVSEKVDLLKEEVGLRLEGCDKLVRGTVIAFGDNEARISFEPMKSQSGEKRREIRRPVWISTIVCGKTSPFTMKCTIVDASKSGCRIEGDNLDRLPREVEISIPGLDLPISAKIVWRAEGSAGVRLNWPFAPAPMPTPEMIAIKLDREKEKEAQKPKPKKRISAFGS